eukprot:scaffold130808_cov63-Phaeocystis_antarctica.AAC.5
MHTHAPPSAPHSPIPCDIETSDRPLGVRTAWHRARARGSTSTPASRPCAISPHLASSRPGRAVTAQLGAGLVGARLLGCLRGGTALSGGAEGAPGRSRPRHHGGRTARRGCAEQLIDHRARAEHARAQATYARGHLHRALVRRDDGGRPGGEGEVSEHHVHVC